MRTVKNKINWTHVIGCIIIGVFLMILLWRVTATIWPAHGVAKEEKSAAIKVNIVDTDPRCCQFRWAKITADGHEYLVFQPAGNGQSVIHSVSCTNCAPKQNTLGDRIDWDQVLNTATNIMLL